MVRFLARTVLGLLANAVGLIVADILLEGLSLDVASFITAVIIFTFATIILSPFILSVAIKSAPYLVGGISLVTTLVGLIITVLISDGITINGLDTWIAATFIVWLFSVLANVILPLFIFKKALGKTKDTNQAA